MTSSKLIRSTAASSVVAQSPAVQESAPESVPTRKPMTAHEGSANEASHDDPAPANARGQVVFDASAALALRERARSWRERVPLVVDSELMFSVAGEDLQAIKALQQDVEAQRVAITGPLNEALRAVNALFRAPRQFLEEAEAVLKGAMLAYTAAERRRLALEESQALRRRGEEQARLAAEQRELESAAHQAEAAARAEDERALRALAAADEAAAAQAQACAAQHRQRAEESLARAHQRAQQAQDAEVVTLPGELAAAPRMDGISERTTYAAQVIDLRQLVAAVAAGQAPLECLQANDKFLAAQARAMRRASELYPGVHVASNRTLAASAGAR